MLRLTIASVVLLVLASGCGSSSGSGDSSDSGESTSEKTADGSATTSDAKYFQRADSDAINKAAAAAQQALATAYAPKTRKKCNAARPDGYPAWRACWHQALDPVEQGLAGLSQEMERLAGQGFPEKCVAELKSAAATFDDMAGQIGRLITGIDSDRLAAQKRAVNAYDRDLVTVNNGLTPAFQKLTQVCYSPEDLASINASPSPTG